MRVICTALVENEMQKSNLCDCVEILGGKPTISGDTVTVEYEGPTDIANKFVELFEQYVVHGIITLS